jgi:hypothetical protein
MISARALGIGVAAMALSGGCAGTNRPRLFLPAGDLAALRERAATTHTRYAQAAAAVHAREAGAAPELPQSPTSWDNWPIEPWTARMVNAAVLSAATRDPAVTRQAVDWLLGLCRCRAAADNNCTYDFYAIALATGYDFLRDDLSASQRETVRRKLAVSFSADAGVTVE